MAVVISAARARGGDTRTPAQVTKAAVDTLHGRCVRVGESPWQLVLKLEKQSRREAAMGMFGAMAAKDPVIKSDL